MFRFSRWFRGALLSFLTAAVFTGCLGYSFESRVAGWSMPRQDVMAPVRESLLFAAPFDNSFNASFAKGDARLYVAPSEARRMAAIPGVPEGGAVFLTHQSDADSDALRISRSPEAVMFYQGNKNLGYRSTNWNGTVFFRLRLDPASDASTNGATVLQLLGRNVEDGAISLGFTADQPRRLQYRFQLNPKLLNPGEQPVVEIAQLPFSRTRWTQVAITFANLNTGHRDGTGKLYLNGKLAGSFTGFDARMLWNPEQSALSLGSGWTGWLDDLAVFDRALSPLEILRLSATNN